MLTSRELTCGVPTSRELTLPTLTLPTLILPTPTSLVLTSLVPTCGGVYGKGTTKDKER